MFYKSDIQTICGQSCIKSSKDQRQKKLKGITVSPGEVLQKICNHSFIVLCIF